MRRVQLMYRADDAPAGWASRSVDTSFQLAEAVGMAIWHLILIYAVLASTVTTPDWLLVGAHLGVFGVACAIAVRRTRAWPVLPLTCATLLLDLYAVADTDSALWFASFWTSLIFTAMPFLVLPVRRAVPFSLLAIVCTAVMFGLRHQDVGGRELAVTVLMAIVLAVAMAALIRALRVYARQVDAHEELAAQERARLTIRRAVDRAAAEDARVMHDTLINTLSLIGRGSPVASTEVAALRGRCAQDVETVEMLLGGRDVAEPGSIAPDASEVPPGITVLRSGLDDDKLSRVCTVLPDAVTAAVHAAVVELVRNAAKHSGVDAVTLDVQTSGDEVSVTVSDTGRGFDGLPVPGRGLAESVVARLREVGVTVAIRSAPGAGTSVTLDIPFGD